MAELEARAFPRLSALAEVLWTRPYPRDPDDFAARLPAQLGRLEAMGVGFDPVDATLSTKRH